MLTQFTSRTKFVSSILFFTTWTSSTSAALIPTHQPNVTSNPGHTQHCILRDVYRTIRCHVLSDVYGLPPTPQKRPEKTARIRVLSNNSFAKEPEVLPNFTTFWIREPKLLFPQTPCLICISILFFQLPPVLRRISRKKNINRKPKDFPTCLPWVCTHHGQANELLFKTC